MQGFHLRSSQILNLSATFNAVVEARDKSGPALSPDALRAVLMPQFEKARR